MQHLWDASYSRCNLSKVPVNNQWRKPLVCMALLCVTLLFSSGCRRNWEQRYIPSEESARHSLEIALKAWENGKLPPGLVQEASPAIQLVDTHYRPGQKLTAFTVLGPVTSDAHRCFAVRLTLDNPREEVRARFVVLGLDPHWVMRYEDYEMICHWCDPVEKPSASKKPRS